MKKTQMLFYTSAVIGLYLSLVLLYANLTSILGNTLLCMSLLLLVLGVFFQWKAGHAGFGSAKHSHVNADSAKAAASC